ncbi:MAG: hypothetical protein DCC67_04505 [Planctomycetota bacterium]|nr:MAG: hypothetical protein DCC67_04505 [Planctomycetota bacterium]
MAAALLALAGVHQAVYAQLTPVSWDGGNGNWEDAKWNGGQTAAAVFGDNRMSNGAYTVTIGGGSQVFYASDTLRDLRPRKNVGNTSITIEDGASLEVNSFNSDTDGVWTQWDADLILDNGTLKRTLTPGGASQAGGLMMLGSWRSVQNQDIKVIVKNGGSLQNNGQLWFGADEEHALGLKVLVEVNNGTIDLTGGTYPSANNSNLVTADVAFFYGTDQGEGNGSSGSGEPKGEHYEINFIGPGSMTVDQSGIWVYDQDSLGAWTGGSKTYEDLWNRGILRSHGINGKTGTAMANFFTVTGTPGAANYSVAYKAPVNVTWDGGNGEWKDAKWNGGQTASAAFGRNNGTENGHNAIIGGGAQVAYDAAANGDFRLKSGNGPTKVTIKEGALLSLDSANTDVDGKWTEWDGDLTLDNGTLRRTHSGTSLSGGILMFGSWRSIQDQEIRIDVKNGGRIENDGQLWFGAEADHALGLKVLMDINNGHLDLTGGDYPQSNGDVLVNADLAFWYGTDQGSGNGSASSTLPKGETYKINFTGPGTITVDADAIEVYDQDSLGVWTKTDATYQDLWTRGILQANGLSGLTGATFGDYFSVTGTAGSADYKLTSLLTAGVAGDYDGDGDVDGNDFLDWQRGGSPNPLSAGDLATWKSAFGSGAGTAAVGAVPEPASLLAALVGAACLAAGARRRTRQA